MKSTSEIILDCVISKIKDGDILDISMSKIANLADIGKSTIYEYFDSKEDMVYSAICKLIDDYLNRWLSCSMELDFYDCYCEHMESALDISEECGIFESIFRSTNISRMKNSNFDKFVESKLLMMYTRLLNISNKGVEEGILNYGSQPKEKKFIILSLLQGVLLNYIAKKTDISKEEMIKMTYDSILKIVNN